MGTFTATVSVANPFGGDHIDVDALVNTGAADSMFPAPLLEGLHLAPRSQMDYVLADDRDVTLGRGQAVMRFEDRAGICPVIFGPAGADNCLLGGTDFQILMLSVDPTNEVLIPTSRARLGNGGRL